MFFLSVENRQTPSTERGESVYPLQKEEADSLYMKERVSSVPYREGGLSSINMGENISSPSREGIQPLGEG